MYSYCIMILIVHKKEMLSTTLEFDFFFLLDHRLSDVYEKWSWICGCPDSNALYCFPCLLFKRPTTTKWNTTGFNDLSNLSKCGNSHSNNKDHLLALSALSLLGKVRVNEALSTAEAQQRTQYNADVKRNRIFLEHHVRATIFLATQGLAFRGHAESKDSFNRGNYVELLGLQQYYSGNQRLADCLYDNSRPVFSGLSGDIQNDLIQCLYEEVIEVIKHDINNSPYLSLIADESTDIANVAQMALCIRYTKEGVAKERLVDLVDVSTGKTADALSAAMKDSLKVILEKGRAKVIGQSYDGASNMAGRNHSVQTRIREEWPHAKFVHCYAHKLALMIKGACTDVVSAVDFFQTISNLCSFFRSSSKRQSLLENEIVSKKKKVPQAAYTRWLTRGKCVKYIHENKHELFYVLEQLSVDDDSATRCEAQGLLTQIKTWENMFLLEVFNIIFIKADIMSEMLQKRQIDCAKADRKLADFQKHLEDMRSDQTFTDIMSELYQLDEEVDFTPPPRVRRRNEQLLRDSGYTPSAPEELSREEKLKQCLVSILDGLSSEFQARFGNLTEFTWMRMLDPRQFDTMRPADLKECIINLKSAYPFITTSTSTIEIQFQAMYGDSDLKDAIGEDVKDVSSLLQKLYYLDIHKALPVVVDIAKLAASTAITSVSCERTFSVLRRIKNYQRNTMTQNRTRNLMVLGVESELTRTLAQDRTFCDKIIDRFARKCNRRIDLIYKE